MNTPQSGIFALGTSSHAYLEFDALHQKSAPELVRAISSLREPRTTIGGINLVVGFRPELWSKAFPDAMPAGIQGFNQDIAASRISHACDPARRRAVALGQRLRRGLRRSAWRHRALKDLATVAEETSSWPYRHDRDLTGFIDGSENPSLVKAPEVVLIPEGNPGAGGTILLLQKWVHDTAKWESLPVEKQEAVMGRMKADSVEIEDKPADSHVASTDQDEFGKVFRRNMPYGTVTNHGTMFVGFSAEQERLHEDAGEHGRAEDRQRDALTRIHSAAHRRILLRPLDGVSASPGRRRLSRGRGKSPR